jgi:hypothetical protein
MITPNISNQSGLLRGPLLNFPRQGLSEYLIINAIIACVFEFRMN